MQSIILCKTLQIHVLNCITYIMNAGESLGEMVEETSHVEQG